VRPACRRRARPARRITQEAGAAGRTGRGGGGGALIAWLIRHGESEGNAGLPTRNAGDSALTTRGVEQARLVAAAFAASPSLIVVSPYRRAAQTAAPTVARFPAVPREEWPVQEFTYLGRLHGRLTTGAERQQFREAYWARADPWYADGPRSESFQGVLGRGRDLLERLRGAGVPRVAVFTHAMFIRATLWPLLGGGEVSAEVSAEEMRRFRAFALGLPIPNGALLELRFGPGGGVAVGGISTAHLPAALLTGTHGPRAESPDRRRGGRTR